MATDSRTKKNAKKGISVNKMKVEPFNSSSTPNINTESNVSVITKTTNPRVVVQRESTNDMKNWLDYRRHNLIKFVCLIVMCVIILITFFLSLKTYNIVNSLYGSGLY